MSDGASLLAAVADSPALLYEIGEILDVGLLIVDADLVVRGANRWLALASGRPHDALAERSLLELFPEMRDGAGENAFRSALGGQSVVLSQVFHRYLLPMEAPPGFEHFERMQQSARLIPIERGGRVDRVLAIVQDVTERVAREEDLRRAMERSEVASQAKSEFLAAMSHELRTPLSAVIGYADIIDGGMVGPILPLQRTYMGRIKTAARHLLSIIEEILTFSRVEAGKERIFIEQIDVTELAREVETLFEPHATEKGLQLRAHMPGDAISIATDATKLRQILINLLGNAVKFTESGEVMLELQRAAGRVHFCVRDTGPGIATEDLARIFEPFTQLDGSHKRLPGGTGLGLPVSQRLAQLLGGELTVQSVPGEGASFSLWLPTAAASASEGATGG